MSIFSRKKPNRFLELLIKQAEYTVEGMQALLAYVKEPSEEGAQQVTHIEKEADEVRRILIDELNRTFVTPIDREDIFALSLTIDDVLDYALLTEEQRQAGLYLVRLNDGRVQLRCRNGAWIDTFDADAPVSEVRYAADMEMMKYWVGTSDCLEGAGE